MNIRATKFSELQYNMCLPVGCEAEVCMSHMDPVSGTDIDLFIEGIIPCSPHLHKELKSTYMHE